jgi:hypothetical protein
MLRRFKQLRRESTGPFRILVVLYAVLVISAWIAATSYTDYNSSKIDEIQNGLNATLKVTILYWLTVRVVLWIIDGFKKRS